MATKTADQWIEELRRMDEEMDQQIAHRGYTRGQLKQIFAQLHDPTDWRGAICVSVQGEAVMPTVAAIEFFTATNPTVQLNIETMRYLVTSDGYRAGPAGDH